MSMKPLSYPQNKGTFQRQFENRSEAKGLSPTLSAAVLGIPTVCLLLGNVRICDRITRPSSKSKHLVVVALSGAEVRVSRVTGRRLDWRPVLAAAPGKARGSPGAPWDDPRVGDAPLSRRSSRPQMPHLTLEYQRVTP
ncbi:hypothetical protein SKAU_G00327610 [Synaphobranchus kaupii]|uniref:Uncharacterized protein n=1 Tax=Synaphobranchus kaupii TaxID=118154 RepID=A0A9Q1EPX0_SYNKA|nr:hypothetical protein SKAU_G00327610 [Synaphobranchus kaupii]